MRKKQKQQNINHHTLIKLNIPKAIASAVAVSQLYQLYHCYEILMQLYKKENNNNRLLNNTQNIHLKLL